MVCSFPRAKGREDSVKWLAVRRRAVVDTESVHMIEVPLMAQAHPHTSGVACVRSILRYAGYSFEQSEDILIRILEASEQTGTPARNITEFLNHVGGYDAEKEKRIRAGMRENMHAGSLRRSITAGAPVICLIQAWHGDDSGLPHDYANEWKYGHYVIAVGFDCERIYFMDPFLPSGYTYLPDHELEARWHGADEKNGTGIVLTIKRPRRRLEAFYKVM